MKNIIAKIICALDGCVKTPLTDEEWKKFRDNRETPPKWTKEYYWKCPRCGKVYDYEPIQYDYCL